MSSNMLTLHEIAMKHAKKQPGIVDDLTEDDAAEIIIGYLNRTSK